MHTHDIEIPPPIPSDDADVSATAVGTFAEGQTAQGSFPVVIGAEVGSFASGQAEDPTPEAM